MVIEVGHKASLLRDKVLGPISGGGGGGGGSGGGDYTHKWNLFVRSGDERQHMDKLVSKVVFHLHATFANPVRECTAAPFCLKEYGYGQFELPIDIHFHGTGDKYSLTYFLELPPLSSAQPLSRLRREIITFINPGHAFRKLLVDNGATVHPLSAKELAARSSSLLLSGSSSSSGNNNGSNSISHNHVVTPHHHHNGFNSSPSASHHHHHLLANASVSEQQQQQQQQPKAKKKMVSSSSFSSPSVHSLDLSNKPTNGLAAAAAAAASGNWKQPVNNASSTEATAAALAFANKPFKKVYRRRFSPSCKSCFK